VLVVSLTGCSSSPPSLYEKWSDKLYDQLTDANNGCGSSAVSLPCVKAFEALAATLSGIRGDVDAVKDADPAKYVALGFTLDNAEVDRLKYVHLSCDAGSGSNDCTLAVTDFIADVYKVVSEMDKIRH
jgi:hypothetical protein